MRNNESVSIHFVRALVANCPRRGIDVVELLRRSRISPRLLREDSARVSIERFANLQVNTIVAMEDESLGYGSRQIPVGSWSIMCHAVIGSDTLGQALARYCRFYQLSEFGRRPVLASDGETSKISLQRFDINTENLPYSTEMVLFHAHRFASWLVGEFLPLIKVKLDHPPATDLADYRHMFLTNPVQFHSDESALVFSTSLLDKRIEQDEVSLRHFLRHPVLVLLTQRYEQDSWTGRVRSKLQRNVEAMPELADIAKEMNVTPFTLRRRLAAEGNNISDLKHQVRRDSALYLLGKQGLSIEEIAHRSGFSESSAFIRAFKVWTGMTPNSYRKGL